MIPPISLKSPGVELVFSSGILESILVSVLAVFPVSAINSPSTRGRVADKLDAYFSNGEAAGLTFAKVLLPGENAWGVKSAYSLVRLPFQARFWLYSLVSFLLQQFNLGALRKRVLVAKSKLLGRMWFKLIESTRPAIVMGIGLPEELLVECSLKSIPSIEAQHGTLNKDSFERYFPNSKPSNMFCWNRHTVDLAKTVGFNAVEVGHPISSLDTRYTNSLSNTVIQSEIQNKTFCVALSWKVVNGSDPFGTLHRNLETMINELVSAGHRPIFRLHPVTSSQMLRRFFLKIWLKVRWPESELHDPRITSLQETARLSGFLVAYESATAYEFGVLGKPSVLLKPESRVEVALALSGTTEPGESLIFSGFQKILDTDFKPNGHVQSGFRGIEVLLGSLPQPKDFFD